MSREIFLDTSAVYALADRADGNHERAKEILAGIVARGDSVVTHDYVLVESAALLQRRLGGSLAAEFLDNALRFFEIVWVDHTAFESALDHLRLNRRRRLSFVDRVSFAVMKDRKIETAFAFDDDFAKEGFKIL